MSDVLQSGWERVLQSGVRVLQSGWVRVQDVLQSGRGRVLQSGVRVLQSGWVRVQDVLQSGGGRVLQSGWVRVVQDVLQSGRGRALMYIQPGGDEGTTVQLISHGSHTVDIDSAPTQLNTETTAATQVPPNGTRVLMALLLRLAIQAGPTMLTFGTSDGQPLGAGSIQLVNHGSNDAHTDELEADSNLDIESAATQVPVEEPPLSDQPMALVTLLGLPSSAGLTMMTIWISNDRNRFSPNQNILCKSAAVFNVVSYLSFLVVLRVRCRRPRITRFLTGTGFLCTAYGFIGIMAMQFLKDSMMLWVAALAAVALFPVLVSME